MVPARQPKQPAPYLAHPNAAQDRALVAAYDNAVERRLDTKGAAYDRMMFPLRVILFESFEQAGVL